MRPDFYLGLNIPVGGGVNVDLIKYECAQTSWTSIWAEPEGSGAWPGILRGSILYKTQWEVYGSNVWRAVGDRILVWFVFSEVLFDFSVLRISYFKQDTLDANLRLKLLLLAS